MYLYRARFRRWRGVGAQPRVKSARLAEAEEAARAEPAIRIDLPLPEAPAAYRGALVVAGHDLPFLASIGITRWLRLDRENGLAEIDPPDPDAGVTTT